ncbi:MAG: hypothetical protein ACRD0H_01105 [Actinomycetes bacterium]
MNDRPRPDRPREPWDERPDWPHGQWDEVPGEPPMPWDERPPRLRNQLTRVLFGDKQPSRPGSKHPRTKNPDAESRRPSSGQAE